MSILEDTRLNSITNPYNYEPWHPMGRVEMSDDEFRQHLANLHPDNHDDDEAMKRSQDAILRHFGGTIKRAVREHYLYYRSRAPKLHHYRDAFGTLLTGHIGKQGPYSESARSLRNIVGKFHDKRDTHDYSPAAFAGYLRQNLHGAMRKVRETKAKSRSYTTSTTKTRSGNDPGESPFIPADADYTRSGVRAHRSPMPRVGVLSEPESRAMRNEIDRKGARKDIRRQVINLIRNTDDPSKRQILFDYFKGLRRGNIDMLKGGSWGGSSQLAKQHGTTHSTVSKTLKKTRAMLRGNQDVKDLERRLRDTRTDLVRGNIKEGVVRTLAALRRLNS